MDAEQREKSISKAGVMAFKRTKKVDKLSKEEQYVTASDSLLAQNVIVFAHLRARHSEGVSITYFPQEGEPYTEEL